MNPCWTEPIQGCPVCLNDCLYMAPISYQEGAVWCALKGAYVEPDRECGDYKERRF